MIDPDDEDLSDQDLHKKAARASFVTRAFIVFAGSALVALLLITAVIVGQIRHQQVQSAGTLRSADAAAKSAQDTADAIHSCVTPGEPCFQQAQRQTAGAVASINRVVILAAACAVGRTGTVSQIQAAIQNCVVQGLAQQKATR